MGQTVSKIARSTSNRVVVPSTTATAATANRGSVAAGTQRETPPPQQQQSTTLPQSSTEMPADLLQFLHDAGPLQKPNNNPKKPLSPRHLQVLSSSSTPEATTTTTTSSSPYHDASRHQHAMPLAQQIDGFNTMRTHSFSMKPDVIDPNDMGLNVLQLYQLLEQPPPPPPRIVAHDATAHAALVQQTRNVLQIPVILQDTDDSYVGASPDRVADLKFFDKLVETPTVQLVLQDLLEQQQQMQHKSIRKIRSITTRDRDT